MQVARPAPNPNFAIANLHEAKDSPETSMFSSLAVHTTRSDVMRRRAGLMRRMLAASLALSPVAAFAQEPAMAPHRAVYDLTLLKSSATGSAPVSASGRIVYDFTGSACEGYTVDFRQLTELQPAEGLSRSSDMRSTSHESADHKTFRFRVETRQGERVGRIVEGSATRSGDGALSIDLRRPEGLQSDVDHDAVFPTEMMMRALKAARAGETTLPVKVYDGSESGDKVYETLSVLGRPSTQPLSDPTKDVAAMKGMKRWATTVSYFDLTKSDSPPVYVLSFQMWDNGVSSDLVLDYGDFKLAGALTKLEMLPAKACQ
jgi:hypothetical protein